MSGPGRDRVEKVTAVADSTRPKVFVCTNIATETIPSRFAIRMIQYVVNVALRQEDADLELARPALLYRHSYLPLARATLTAQFMASAAEYMVCLDADQTWEPNAIGRLVSHRAPVVSGVYYSTLPPHLPVIRNWDPEVGHLTAPQQPLPKGRLIEVDAVGAGFLCVRRDVIEAIGHEAWIPAPDIEWGQSGEDMAFCYRAKRAGFPIMVDPDIRVGHLATVEVGEGSFLQALALLAQRDGLDGVDLLQQGGIVPPPVCVDTEEASR